MTDVRVAVAKADGAAVETPAESGRGIYPLAGTFRTATATAQAGTTVRPSTVLPAPLRLRSELALNAVKGQALGRGLRRTGFGADSLQHQRVVK